MAIISLIVAMDKQGAIGKNQGLLCHLPADLQYFKSKTMQKPIIMGRKTYDSIGRVLPGRWNIILTSQTLSIQGATVVHSLKEALHITEKEDEIMVIGGANVFEQTLPLAKRLYITLIHHQFKADVFFPKWNIEDWQCVSCQDRPADSKNPYDLTFYEYLRV